MRKIVSIFLSCVLICIWSQVSSAQIKAEKEEEVKIFFLNDWYDGVIVDIKGPKYLIEYEFAGSTKQKVYKRKDFKRMYESEGVDWGRIWKSAGGSFKIEASLKSIDGDNVVLIRPDLTTITVPLSKLSKADEIYVGKLTKNRDKAIINGEAPAITPTLPEIEDFGGSFQSISTFGGNGQGKIAPFGSTPKYLNDFEQSGTGFNMIRKKQELISVIPVGGPDQIVLMGSRERNPFKKGEKYQSQLYWVSLKERKVTGFVSITHEDYPLDYDPRYKLLLTFNRNEEFIGETDEPDNYTLWKLSVGGKTAEPIVRWRGKGMGWASHQFGKIVNDSIVVVKTEKQTYEGFDIKQKKSLYVIKSGSFFDSPVVLSPDRKKLILPEDGRVSVVDATTGEYSFSLKVKDPHTSGANINSQGDRLAAITDRNLYVWDLQSGDETPEVYPAPLMGSPFKSRIEWITDDLILGESHSSRILYQLSLKLPIWSYEMDVSQYFLNQDPLKNMVVGGKFFYVARPETFGSSIAVGAVQLPGPSVKETVGNVDRESLMVLKRGAELAVDASSLRDQEIEGWLIEKIESNGWVYNPNAELVMVPTMGQGKPQTTKYTNMRGGGSQSVSFTPHFSRLRIMRGNTIIWQAATSTGAPPVIFGGNAQGQVSRMQKPNREFFRSVRIDKEIIDPKYSRGFGVSKLGLRGIEVVSTSPPGREDDPEEASRKADEDRRNSQKDDENPESGR